MPSVRVSDILSSVMGSDHAPVRIELDNFTAPAAVPAKPLALSSRNWPTQTKIASFFKPKPAPVTPPASSLAQRRPREAVSALPQPDLESAPKERKTDV